jgi:hypothetical protein
MIQLISLFKEEGYDVTFACPAMESVYMIDLESLNAEESISLNSSSFDVFIKS